MNSIKSVLILLLVAIVATSSVCCKQGSSNVENPNLVAAIKRLSSDESQKVKDQLADELNDAKYLALVLSDDNEYSAQKYEGKAYIKTDEPKKLIISADANSNKYLELYTDVDAIGRCGNTLSEKTVVIQASEVWDLLLKREDNIGAIVNPCYDSIPLGKDQVKHLYSILNKTDE